MRIQPAHRPSHRTVSMWSDLQAVLGTIRTVEFLLGLLPEKPDTSGIDLEAVKVQLDDARALLGQIAFAVSEEAG